MRRPFEPLKIYHNQELMNEVNKTFVAIKTWLHGIDSIKASHPKPTARELDDLQRKINQVLKQSSEDMRKY